VRGFLAISNEAAALAECRPEFAGAIVRLYRQADAMGWRRPFPCADAWLMIRFGLSKRQAREMLTLLVDSGCIDVVSEGDNRTPRRVNVICPLDAILDRSKAARVADSSGAADRRTKNETCGNAVPDDVDCRPDRRLDRRLDRSESTPAADPSVDADRRPDRRLDRRLDRSNSDSRSGPGSPPDSSHPHPKAEAKAPAPYEGPPAHDRSLGPGTRPSLRRSSLRLGVERERPRRKEGLSVDPGSSRQRPH
jgi:hypothetical protein